MSLSTPQPQSRPGARPGPPWHIRGQIGGRLAATLVKRPVHHSSRMNRSLGQQWPHCREAWGGKPRASRSARPPLLASTDVICKRLQRQLLGEAGHLLRLFQPPTPLFRPRETIRPFLSPISYHSGGRCCPAARGLCSRSRPKVGWGQGGLAGSGATVGSKERALQMRRERREEEKVTVHSELRWTPNMARAGRGSQSPTPACDSEGFRAGCVKTA